jgi:exodeoxyribonuclease VII small subunit
MVDMSAHETEVEGLNYEQAFQELEKIVASLEANEHSLDKALELFERGQALARYCAGLLDKAELKVQQVSGEGLVDFSLGEGEGGGG